MYYRFGIVEKPKGFQVTHPLVSISGHIQTYNCVLAISDEQSENVRSSGYISARQVLKLYSSYLAVYLS